MITIIHGDDIKSSRNFYFEKKSSKKESTLLNGETVKLTDVVQILEGGELFQTEKNIFIEEFLGKRKQSAEFDEIISCFSKTESQSNITFWESKTLTKKQLSYFPKAIIKIFKLPQAIFTFLDALSPKNGKRLVFLFHETLKYCDPEFVFYMSIRHFRLLIALSSSSFKTPIDEVVRLSPWQRSKLQKQVNLFSLEDLKKTYQKLFELDLSQKTGKLSVPLSTAIDFLLLEI